MAATVLPGPYRRVLSASSLSNLSDGIRSAAFPLLAVQLTSSPFLVGLVFVASLAPGLLFSLAAGTLADRVDRVSLARRVNTARVVLLVGLAFLIVLGQATITVLLAAAFCLGVSEVLADNVFATIVPSLVDDDQLELANSRMVAAEIMGNEFAGPAIGGLLFSIGIAVPFFSNAGLLACSVLLLAGMPSLGAVTSSGDQAQSEVADIDSGRTREGVVFLRQSPVLRTLTLASGVLLAIDSAWFAMLVVFATNTLGLPETMFGLLLAAGACGGLGGAAIAGRWPRLSLHQVTGGVFASMSVSLAALALFPTVMLTIVVLVVSSAAFAVWNVFAGTARQRLTPDHLLGRVSGAYRSVLFAAAIAGTLVGGVVAELFDVRVSLLGAGMLTAVTGPFLFGMLGKAQD